MSSLFKRFISPVSGTTSDIGYFIIRLSFGLLVAYHGYGKISSFSDLAPQFADPFGLGSKTTLILVIFAEFACGLLIAVGLFTRLAAIPVLFTFMVIYFKIHGSDSFGDKELPAAYLLLSLGVLLAGPGKISVDARMSRY